MSRHVSHKTKVIGAEDIGHIVTQLVKAQDLGYEITVDVHQDFEEPSDFYAEKAKIVINMQKGEEEINESN